MVVESVELTHRAVPDTSSPVCLNIANITCVPTDMFNISNITCVHDCVVSLAWWQGRVDDFSFFDRLSPFYFSLIEFHCIFPMSYKYYNIMFIINVF